MTKFQGILTGVFVFFMIVGLGVFATFRGSSTNANKTLTLWGVVPREIMVSFLGSDVVLGGGWKIAYIEKDKSRIERDVLEAIAAGGAPDFLLLPQDLLLSMESKLVVIPWSSYRERDFKEQFTEGSEIFLTKNGVLGFPLAADPLLMYWNRSLFQTAGIASAPKQWAEFPGLSQKLTVLDKNKNIIRSVAPLGEYGNIRNAKALLSALLMQAGTPIVAREKSGVRSALLDRVPELDVSPTESVLRFYTEFSDANKNFYSWNKSLPNSQDAFLQGKVATYFGFGSELPHIRDRNPNLNFYIAPLPQISGAVNRSTFGNFYAFVFPKQGGNLQGALTAALFFTSPQAASEFARLSLYTPVRRDLLSQEPSDAYLSILYESSLIAKAWLEPSPEASDALFKDLVQSITSGRERIGEAAGRVSNELQGLLANFGTGQNLQVGGQ